MLHPDFIAAVRRELKSIDLTPDDTAVERIAAEASAKGKLAWISDAAGSPQFIASEAANIAAAVRAVIGYKAPARPRDTTPPADLLIFGHDTATWRQLDMITRKRFVDAGLAAAAKRGESADLLAARLACAENRADGEQMRAVAEADREFRAAASTPRTRASARAAAKAEDAKIADEVSRANGAAVQRAGADPAVRKLAASAGAFAVKNARRDLETYRRTIADPSANANVKAYVSQLRDRAQKTLERYGLQE